MESDMPLINILVGEPMISRPVVQRAPFVGSLMLLCLLMLLLYFRAISSPKLVTMQLQSGTAS